jgi:hypothetical protein
VGARGAAEPGAHPVFFHIQAQNGELRELIEKSVFLVPR